MIVYHKEMFAAEDSILVQHCLNAADCEEHEHEFLEFVYVARGEGVHYIDSVAYPVRRGSLLFINFSQTHSFTKTDEYYNILLLPDYIGDGLARETKAVFDLFALVLGGGVEGNCVNFSGAEIEQIEWIVRTLYTELSEKKEGYRDAAGDLFHLLITRVLRKMKGGDKAKEAANLAEILDWIRGHYAENPTLAEVSERFFYNSSYFSRMFKRFTGAGYNAYLNHLKIDAALALLEDGNLSAQEIAERVGYGDVKSFYQQFKKLTGSTPGAFRQRAKRI